MSNRSDIIAAIKYNLDRITTANGYSTNVRTVEHRAILSSEVPSGQRPYVGYRFGPERIEWVSFYYAHVTAKVTILAILTEDVLADAHTAADNFIQDVAKRFMRVDPGLRGAGSTDTVSSCAIIAWDADAADKPASAGDQVEIELELVYNFTPPG